MASGGAQTAETLITLTRAGARGHNRWLVRGVDLTVRRGEIVTLIGPNGSGKSTTAKMALGILKPTEGSAERVRGIRVGYVPQTLAIDWTVPLTVDRFMHLTERLGNDAATAALETVGIAHLRKDEVRHLSGGEFQRALLARAIARSPDLLVLDEPVQGVDFNGQIALYELISSLRDRLGCGVLMISHDLHIVMAATDSVVCLNGHVCCSGAPSVVAENPAYRALFGTVGATAIAVYEHQHDHTHLPDGTVRHRDGSVTEHCHPDDGHHDAPAAKAETQKRQAGRHA